ncbi:hypothetical protein VDG1235_1193 [Verrucomicrobiia bacterium DG1235]|nr:hypothetical protein VDG1235_1193 [Verrucomicrobiae bacterium DG1235]
MFFSKYPLVFKSLIVFTCSVLPVAVYAVPKASSVSLSPSTISLGGSVSVTVSITKSSGDNWVGGVAYIHVTPPGGSEMIAGTISSTAFSSGNSASFNYSPSSAGSWAIRASITGTYQNGPTIGSVNAQKTSYKYLTVNGATANQAPTVSSLSASPASPYEGSSVTVSASASDSDGTIANVKFYRNGALVTTDTSAAYIYSTSRSTPGSYSFYAISTDNDNSSSSASPTKTVTWVNKTPTVNTPTVSSGSIEAGQSVTVYVVGSDPGGLKYVRFYRNNSLVHTISNPSDSQTSFSWTYSNAASGTSTFKVQVEDDEGSKVTSANVNVSVQALTSGLTFDPLISPGPNFYNKQQIAITASTNSSTVDYVQFFLDGSWQFTDVDPPYHYHILPAYSGNHTVQANFHNSSGGIVQQDTISFTVSSDDPPYETERWVDVDGNGIYDYVEDYVTPNKNPYVYDAYVRYGAPSTGYRGLLMFHVPDYVSYCTSGWLGIASSTSFTLISDRINGFFGRNWGWDYSIASNVWVHETNCNFEVFGISNRMEYYPAYEEGVYRIQSSNSLDNGGWVNQGLDVQAGASGDFQVVFGDYSGIKHEPNVVRVVRMGTPYGGSGNVVPGLSSLGSDLDGDGIFEQFTSLQPVVTNVTRNVGGTGNSVFDLEIPTGIILDPLGVGSGRVVQVKMKSIGDVLYEKTVEYITTGEVSPSISVSINLPGDFPIDLTFTFMSKSRETIHVPINDDSDAPNEDDLVAILNPFYGESYGYVEMKLTQSGTGRLKVWKDIQMTQEYVNGQSWSAVNLGEILYLDGRILSENAGDIEVSFTHYNGTNVDSKLFIADVYPLELDIRETAQNANRVGLNDPRVPSSPSQDARNKILIWRKEGALVEFDMLRTSRAHGPVWVEIENRNGANDPNLPQMSVISAGPATFSHRIKFEEFEEDFVVQFGKDLDGDGRLTGNSEVKGEYEVYGISFTELQNGLSAYSIYKAGLTFVADVAHDIFMGGGNNLFGYNPDLPTQLVDLEFKKITHLNGATFNLISTPHTETSTGTRPYVNGLAKVPKFRWSSGSPASLRIANSDEFKDKIRGFIAASFTDIDYEYTKTSSTGPKAIDLPLKNLTFEFGALNSIGLGGVTVGNGPTDSQGTIRVVATKIGAIYEVDPTPLVNFFVRDVFDFNYFNEKGNNPVFAGIEIPANASRAAASIQTSSGKSGATATGNYGTRGQVALLEFEIGQLVDLGSNVEVLP